MMKYTRLLIDYFEAWIVCWMQNILKYNCLYMKGLKWSHKAEFRLWPNSQIFICVINRVVYETWQAASNQLGQFQVWSDNPTQFIFKGILMVFGLPPSNTVVIDIRVVSGISDGCVKRLDQSGVLLWQRFQLQQKKETNDGCKRIDNSRPLFKPPTSK